MFVSGNQLCDLTRSEGYIQMNCVRKQICLNLKTGSGKGFENNGQVLTLQVKSVMFSYVKTLQLHHKSHCPDHHDL